MKYYCCGGSCRLSLNTETDLLNHINMACFKFGNKLIKEARGFTLIELLVIISILGVMGAVVTLNVTRFIGAGADEALAYEREHVYTAAGCYLVSGNTLAAAISVGPGNKGVLAPWLIGDLQNYWTINPDGSISNLLYGSALNSLDGFTVISGGWTAGPGGLDTGGTDGTLMADGGNWDDFTFDTTATITSGNDYNLLYRSDDTGQNGYVVNVDASGNIQVSTIVGGVVNPVPIATGFVPGGLSGQQSISVSVNGSSHTISVGGSTVMSFQDSTFGSGTVGLQSSAGSDVNFTGFTVSPP
jgi:prepilin-type N-terminal cleavage/methylation domain-containing protein